jgi:hypothetical protein
MYDPLSHKPGKPSSLRKKTSYHIYRGPCFADIEKEPELFVMVANNLRGDEAREYAQRVGKRNGEILIASFADYGKDETPAAYL